MKLCNVFMLAAGPTGGYAETKCLSRRTTRDKKMTTVTTNERSVATRARPKMNGLLSVFSLIPSYRYSPPKRDRTGPNHDRLNIMMNPPEQAHGNEDRCLEMKVLPAERSTGSLDNKNLACIQRNEVLVEHNHSPKQVR